MSRALRLLALALVAALAAGGPLGAQSRSLSLERFDATLTVGADGGLEVVETLRFRFTGSWNGVFRSIPVEYEDDRGFRYRLDLDVRDVRSGEGGELRHEISRDGRYRKIKVWVPDAVDREATVLLRYDVGNGLRFFENHDELYWNVTGTEWDIPIRRATARVVLPEGATGRRANAFTGAFGAKGTDARVTEVDEGFVFENIDELGFREGMTVVVGWDPGVVERPTEVDRAISFLGMNWMLFVPLVTWFGMWRLWLARGRDPKQRPVNPVYAPPEGLTPAEVGTLVDNSVDMRDITATLVDLAVRGYLVIEEEESGRIARWLGQREYTFVRRDDADERALHPHERRLLDGLFVGRGGRVGTDDLERTFYREVPDIKDAVMERLVSGGYYPRRPDRELHVWIVVGLIFTVGAVVGLSVLAVAMALPPTPAVIGGVLAGLPVLIFGIFMPARSVKGVRTLEGILGFEEFLERVESDRFRRMITSPEQFEAFLPYAMALKVEKQWARAFEDLYREPPEWYRGRTPDVGFRATNFVASLDDVTSRTGSAMASAPRSSSSSSSSSGFSSGGGFSGGGFGGGGGGGF